MSTKKAIGISFVAIFILIITQIIAQVNCKYVCYNKDSIWNL